VKPFKLSVGAAVLAAVAMLSGVAQSQDAQTPGLQPRDGHPGSGGLGTPLWGSGLPVYGVGAPIAGGGMPLWGGGVPIYGSGVPIYGSGVPVYGSGVPIYGSGVPVYGSGVPIYGSGVPVYGSGVPIYGSGVPVYGSGVPIYGSGIDFKFGIPVYGSGQAAGTGAPHPVICMMKPTDGSDNSDIAVIAQTQDACASIGGTASASGVQPQTPAAASN